MKKKYHNLKVEKVVSDLKDDQIDSVVVPSKHSKNKWVDVNIDELQMASECDENRIMKPHMEETRIGEDHSVDQSLM